MIYSNKKLGGIILKSLDKWEGIHARTGYGDTLYNGTPLTTENSHLLVRLLMMERNNESLPTKVIKNFLDANVAAQILKKRIEVLGLPIKFSDAAYCAISCFCNVPGHVVVLLIDCLEEFENETVTVDKLCMLYPVGFYTDEDFRSIIENKEEFLKRKWAYIY